MTVNQAQNKTEMKKYALLFIFLLLPFVAEAQYSVSSPDMSVQVYLKVEWKRNLDTKAKRPDGMKMTVQANGKTIFRNRDIGIDVSSGGHRHSFGKAFMVNSHNSRTPLALGKESESCLKELGDKYNRLFLQSSTGITLELLVFNHGVAYRFSVTGYPDKYKILDAYNVFPSTKPNAILGTFTGDTVLPWRTMSLDEEAIGETATTPATDEWENLYPSTKIVSWKDALPSASIGFTINWFTGHAWGPMDESSSIYADFIYKYLYAGVSITPCHELLYIYFEHDFPPFDNNIGSIHSWDVSGKLGFSLPVQIGFNVWNISPYATATYLTLLQHGETHPAFQPLSNKRHYLVGMGLKVQCMLHGRISLGMGYEYQVFTGKSEPKGRNALSLTLGYGF